MLVALMLRNYKTYQGISYIPLTDEDNFCGLVGNNGIGKSSILESLDSFFNNKPWNYNTTVKKSGLAKTSPFIVPVFFIKKDFLKEEFQNFAAVLSDAALATVDLDVNSAFKAYHAEFLKQLEKIKLKNNSEDYFLFPLGVGHDGDVSISFFNNQELVKKFSDSNLSENTIDANKKSLSREELNEFKPLLDELRSSIDYIYIPKDIDPETFTKLETEEIQILMGERLTDVISQKFSRTKISQINTDLQSFIDSITNELGSYSYRTPTDRQQNIRRNEVYNLIISSFFSTRKIHKKQGDHWLQMSLLSSGEKQKAIIEIAHSFLSKHRDNGSNVIFAFDEPESSLHISACFDQFELLFGISRCTMQVLFSTHWYGFLPSLDKGSATVITKNDSDHFFDLVNLSNYREEVKQLKSLSTGSLPFDVRLKSINDFIQTLIMSTCSEQPYNWIICEGSSEKNYFKGYMKDVVDEKRLRIVPVGGVPEIKKIYEYLHAMYDDIKNQMKGKILLVADTDSQIVSFTVDNNAQKLLCKRIVNVNGITELKNFDSNIVSPVTAVEDALNWKLFHETLFEFEEKFENEFLQNLEVNTVVDECNNQYLDLKQSEMQKIKKFFDSDNNKYDFSKKYVENLRESYKIPKWFSEMRDIF